MAQELKINAASSRIFDMLEEMQLAPDDALLVLTGVAASLICYASSSVESAERARNIMNAGIADIMREHQKSHMSGWQTRVQ